MASRKNSASEIKQSGKSKANESKDVKKIVSVTSASLLWGRMTRRLNAKYAKVGFTLAVWISNTMNTKYWRHTFWAPSIGTVPTVIYKKLIRR